MSLIEHAEPNYLVEASFTPNDPFFPYQYNLSKINAPAAWDITQSNSSVKIAIIDTGVQLNHPELASKLLPGYDYVDYDNIPEDGNGHGTHVAGIAALCYQQWCGHRRRCTTRIHRSAPGTG